MSVQKCVARGAKLLDETHPDWWQKINPFTLDMIYNCVLDQVMGNWDTARIELGITEKTTYYGLAPSGNRSDSNAVELRNEWLRVVGERRQASSV